VSVTDRVVREAIRLVDSIAYFSLVHEGELRILFVRPWGSAGQGLWLRSVLGPPWRLVPAWGPRR